jgi:4-nitrophenyl phosphatase
MDYRGVIVDLDGTVYRGETLISGVTEAIERLRDRGVSLLFLTNNPTRTRESYTEHLDAMGLHVSPEEILSAGTVTTRYLVANHATDQVFVIGSSGLREQFESAGIEMTDDPALADVVVTSHDHNFDYEDLTEGLWALDNAGTFIGTDPDLVYPNDNGRPLPGSGAITTAVAGVADREPDAVLGKPAPETVEIVLETIDHSPEDWLVVGDQPDTDIAFGERAGMETALVRSGLTEQDDTAVDPEPDYVVDTLADIESIPEF